MLVAVGSNAPWPGASHAAQFSAPVSQEPPLAPRNAVELSREMLFMVLEHFSTMVASEFSGLPIRLVAHGGACMLLHNGLHELANRKALYHSTRGENASRRTTTRDVDYIHRSFVAESTMRGIINAGERLQRCIRATARQFGLGADWMNSDADVALPMSTDPKTGLPFDPIYTESVKENNIQLYTVFTSSNRLLTIVNVTPFWAVALKLVRYAKWDPGDICLLLLFGSVARGVRWTTENLEGWIRVNCSAMNYHNWDSARIMDMRQKIAHAVTLISSIGTSIMAQPGNPLLPPRFPDHTASATGSIATIPSRADSLSHGSGAHLTLSSNSFQSNHATPSTTGPGWAGPASDAAIATRKQDTSRSMSVDTLTETRSLFLEVGNHPVSDPPTRAHPTHAPPFRHASESDLKERSRRKERKTREHARMLQRRLKYMLRADEPDDSDLSEPNDSSDTDKDTDSDNLGQAPFIPVLPGTSTIGASSTEPLRAWGSTPSVFPNRSWTQRLMTEEPIQMDSLEPGNSHPPPIAELTRPTHPPSHSRSWPITRVSEPPPRSSLISPLLEPPERSTTSNI